MVYICRETFHVLFVADQDFGMNILGQLEDAPNPGLLITEILVDRWHSRSKLRCITSIYSHGMVSRIYPSAWKLRVSESDRCHVYTTALLSIRCCMWKFLYLKACMAWLWFDLRGGSVMEDLYVLCRSVAWAIPSFSPQSWIS